MVVITIWLTDIKFQESYNLMRTEFNQFAMWRMSPIEHNLLSFPKLLTSLLGVFLGVHFASPSVVYVLSSIPRLWFYVIVIYFVIYNDCACEL